MNMYYVFTIHVLKELFVSQWKILNINIITVKLAEANDFRSNDSS